MQPQNQSYLRSPEGKREIDFQMPGSDINRRGPVPTSPGGRKILKALPDGSHRISKMVYLTRRERFNAAHKLWVESWSEEKNLEVFGKCANKNWHGHNYDLFVTVKGHPDPQTGFVMDVKRLSDLIKQLIIEKVDHSNLNLDVDFIPAGMQPSTENLAILFWQQLEPHLTGCRLHCIKLYETENIFVEYYGE